MKCGAIYQNILLSASKKVTVQFDKFVKTDEKLLQQVIDVEIRYDQVKFLIDFHYYKWHCITYKLIYCTRKISRIKTRGVHKNIKFCSLKSYAVDVYRKALREIHFPNYKNFVDVNQAYSNFFQKLMRVIDNVAPCKTKRVKGRLKIGLIEKYLKNLSQETNS